jgi:hypothetical protein
MFIPFNKPYLTGKEFYYMQEAASTQANYPAMEYLRKSVRHFSKENMVLEKQCSPLLAQMHLKWRLY